MTDGSVKIAEEQLDVLADRIAVRIAMAPRQAGPMLTVEDICERFRVSRAWVYQNAARLGGVKLGSGRRAPLRFETVRVEAALEHLSSPAKEVQARPRRRPRGGYTLPVHDG